MIGSEILSMLAVFLDEGIHSIATLFWCIALLKTKELFSTW